MIWYAFGQGPDRYAGFPEQVNEAVNDGSIDRELIDYKSAAYWHDQWIIAKEEIPVHELQTAESFEPPTPCAGNLAVWMLFSSEGYGLWKQQHTAGINGVQYAPEWGDIHRICDLYGQWTRETVEKLALCYRILSPISRLNSKIEDEKSKRKQSQGRR